MGVREDVIDESAIAAVERFEAVWHDRIGGAATTDLRFMMGIALSQLVNKHNVDPHALADYLREALRLQVPQAFDQLS